MADRFQLEWEHGTEEQWIIDDIAEAIVAFRKEPGPAGPRGRVVISTLESVENARRFSVALPSGEANPITIDHHIWAPASYVALAAWALDGAAASPVTPSIPASSLEALTTPLPDVIQRENLRISSVLQADIRSADAHEEAALILAALALREGAGQFSDPRGIMSRMTAHLAMADHLRPSSGIAGRVADAALLTLAGRETDALAILQDLEKQNAPGLRAWVRALRLRNTNDWRPTRNDRSLTLLEQLETLRAIQATLGSDIALDYVEGLPEVAPTTTWTRILLQGNASVEAGNKLTRTGVDGELAEAVAMAQEFGLTTDLATPKAIVEALNRSPQASARDERDGTIRIIDWGLWAAASQRHLIMQLQAAHRHLNDRLGLRGKAKGFAGELEAFEGLTMFPLLRPFLASDADSHRRALEGVVDVCRRRPDLVTFEVWEYLFQQPTFAAASATTMVAPNGPWFTPLFPTGTVFDAGNRAVDTTVKPPQARLALAEAQRLRALAPTERIVVMEAVRFEHGNWPSYSVMQREYGELTAYDLILARRVARAAFDTPDAYVPLMRHVGELNSETLGELGAYLADRGRAAEAQAVYEEWIAKCRDRVTVSNGVWWLVRRYHELGQPQRAAALAQLAADVYSFRGLTTRADLHDWRGEYAAALRIHEAAAERYDTHQELLAFYLRRAADDEGVRAKRDGLLPRIFPKGLETVTIGDFTSEPERGVWLIEVGESGRRAGLRNYDIVVAVDGIRVADYKQYRAARGAATAQEMTLIVWRQGGTYVEVRAPLRYAWPVTNLQDYVRGRAMVATR